MPLTKDVLHVETERVAEDVVAFIRDEVGRHYRRKGAVVGLSGGIDSSVTAALAVRALGKDKVLGLILPERESSPTSERLAWSLATRLGIDTERADITRMLESFGVYEKRDRIVGHLFPDVSPPYRFRIVLPQGPETSNRLSVFSIEVEGKNGDIRRKRLGAEDLWGIVAATDIKQRTRMVMLYYYAETLNFVVVGTTNRSETDQGFYVKYGDGGVDLEPLAHLYKTQVYQLAAYLDIPEEIIERPPSPDTYSLEVSDQEFYFRLPYETVDLCLYAIDHRVPASEVAEALDLEERQVEWILSDLRRKRALTWHLRELPPSPAGTNNGGSSSLGGVAW